MQPVAESTLDLDNLKAILVANKERTTLNSLSWQLILTIYAKLKLVNPEKSVNDVILEVSSLCGPSKTKLYSIKKEQRKIEDTQQDETKLSI